MFRTNKLFRRGSSVWLGVATLLAIHAALLAHSATRHSPTMLEPAFLVAGLSHWEFGQFELFRVNPPLVRLVAALPVMAVGYEADWSGFDEAPGARPEFAMGTDFIKANGERSIWLFTIARWACVPFDLLGALFCFFWSRELGSHNGAGLISLIVWCFEPNILAHGELITSDCAATSFGVGAGYFFWRWLKQPTLDRAAVAGLLLGLAELAKFSWLILYALWPTIWVFWLWFGPYQERNGASQTRPNFLRSGLQLAFMLLLGGYFTNLAYAFTGTGTRLGELQFVSHMLGGHQPGEPGNRFVESLWKDVPVPLPQDYLLGIDLQKKDFEEYRQPSYLRGEWKDGGWWYYYLYGLAVKTPHGLHVLLVLGSFTMVFTHSRSRRDRSVTLRDLVVLFTPPLALLVLVSSQLEFNQHIRYVLPVLGFMSVFIGVMACRFPVAIRNSACLSAQFAERIYRAVKAVKFRIQRYFPSYSFSDAKSVDTALQMDSTHCQLAIQNGASDRFRFAKRIAVSAGGAFMVRICELLILGSLVAAITSTLFVYPHQLAYFNEMSGGPQNGYKHLLGSNLEWGQDLLLLRHWFEERNVSLDQVDFAFPHSHRVKHLFPTQFRTDSDDQWRAVSAQVIAKGEDPVSDVGPSSSVQRIGYTFWTWRQRTDY